MDFQSQPHVAAQPLPVAEADVHRAHAAMCGDSVGQVLEKQWAERPCTLVGGSLLTVRQRVERPCLTLTNALLGRAKREERPRECSSG